LAQGLARVDQIYVDALSRGVLRPDPTLSFDHPAIDPGLAKLIEAGRAAEAAQAAAAEAAQRQADAEAALVAPPVVEAKPLVAVAPVVSISIQFVSPDARAVDGALAAVRAVPGIENVASTSIALGGTSVMKAQYPGGAEALAAALRARGWQVSVAGGALRIKR